MTQWSLDSEIWREGRREVMISNNLEDFEFQVTPPTDGQLESGLERPSVPLRTLKSKFRVGFDFKVLPDSVIGEAKPPFIVFSMKKYVGIGGQVVIQ